MTHPAPAPRPATPCVFFDRDGIVNVAPGPGRYVERVEDFHLQPEFVNVLRKVLARGYQAVIVTNQRGVARGRMTLQTVHDIHARLQRELAAEGLALLDILVCPDADDASPRRKPNPGMLLEAAQKHHLDLSKSWMIGDDVRDVEAGRRAGCRTVFVGPPEQAPQADYCVRTMAELSALIETHLDPVGLIHE